MTTLLVDFDSILYKSVYRCLNRPQNADLGIPERNTVTYCRELLKEYDKPTAKQHFLAEVYNQSLNRCENELLKMKVFLEYILNSEITEIELYITTCKNSFRKSLTPTYKANRKVRNKYVGMIREYYQDNEAFYSDTLEADDLIAMRVEELGRENCIIASLDKDLRTIGGFLWNYQKVAETDLNGEIVINEYGNKEMTFKYNDVEWITPEKASYYFWLQMLMGDSGDGISGLKKVGIKTAEKILENSINYFVRTAREYISRGQKQDFWINYKLLKLGKMNKAYDIIEIVNKYFNTDVLANTESRKRIHVYPRQVAQYCIYKYCTLTYSKIGKIFNQNHASIFHNINKFEDDLAFDKQITESYLNIKKLIEKSLIIFSEDALIKKGFKLVKINECSDSYINVYQKENVYVEVNYRNSKLSSWDVYLESISFLKLSFSELLQLDAILNK